VSAAAAVNSTISGPSGVKMAGPYAWVPPNYWSDPTAKRLYGGASGFSTEISPGASPLTLDSWLRVAGNSGPWPDGAPFSDTFDYHCGNQHGVFRDLSHFTPSLQARYGSFSSAREFLSLSQLAAYEAHRAMFEAYSAAKYEATGVIQWMLNNGMPQHIWHLYDWFLVGGGAYYGAKQGLGSVNLQFDVYDGRISLINSLYTPSPALRCTAAIHSMNGTRLWHQVWLAPQLAGDGVLTLGSIHPSIPRNWAERTGNPVFLRLSAELAADSADGETGGGERRDQAIGGPISVLAVQPNWYWLSKSPDVVDWNQCNFYVCNTTSTEDFRQLANPTLFAHRLAVEGGPCPAGKQVGQEPCMAVSVKNLQSDQVAFALALTLLGHADAVWSDNYISLLPGEERSLTVRLPSSTENEIEGAQSDSRQKHQLTLRVSLCGGLEDLFFELPPWHRAKRGR